MRPARYLEYLVVNTERRLHRLKASVIGIQPASGFAEQRRLSFALIEAANLWTQFCRTFYLSTALQATDGAGERTSVSSTLQIKSRVDAITVAVQVYSKKKQNQPGPFTWFEEPKWHEAPAYLKVVRGTACSNAQMIEQALGYQAQSREDIIVARNFFAHKSEDTASKVRALAPQYSLSPRLAPAAFMTSIQPGQNQPIVLNWFDDLLGTVELMK